MKEIASKKVSNIQFYSACDLKVNLGRAEKYKEHPRRGIFLHFVWNFSSEA